MGEIDIIKILNYHCIFLFNALIISGFFFSLLLYSFSQSLSIPQMFFYREHHFWPKRAQAILMGQIFLFSWSGKF